MKITENVSTFVCKSKKNTISITQTTKAKKTRKHTRQWRMRRQQELHKRHQHEDHQWPKHTHIDQQFDCNFFFCAWVIPIVCRPTVAPIDAQHMHAPKINELILKKWQQQMRKKKLHTVGTRIATLVNWSATNTPDAIPRTRVNSTNAAIYLKAASWLGGIIVLQEKQSQRTIRNRSNACTSRQSTVQRS